MAGSTPIYSLPYPEATDLVADYPALGQDLAEDLDTILAAKMDSIQVIETTASSQYYSTSTSFVDANLAATITPSANTSKILVLVSQQYFTNQHCRLQILRGATAIYTTGAEGAGAAGSATAISQRWTAMKLDSPATTSATTYKVQIRMESTGGVYWNSNGTIASIQLMEIPT